MRAMSRPTRPMPTAQRGVALVEVLISVLLLSLGLLGIAMTQTRALASNNSSSGRSAAVIVSYSILEKMRGDRISATAGSYNTTVTASACPTDVSTLANHHLADWCAQLGDALGAASTTRGTISCTATADCTITLQYDDSHVGVAGTSSTPAGMAGSTTLQIVVRAIL